MCRAGKNSSRAFFWEIQFGGLDDVGGSEVVHILYAVRKETAAGPGGKECERRESVSGGKKMPSQPGERTGGCGVVRKKRARK